MSDNFSMSYNSLLTKVNVFFISLFPIAILAGSFISNLFIIIIDIIFILELIKNKNRSLIKDKNFIFLIIIFFYIIFNSVYISSNKSYDLKPYESIVSAIGFLRFILLAYALSYYINFYKSKILNIWLFIFIIVSVDILFEYIFGFNLLGFNSIEPSRIASFRFKDLNIGGFYFGLFFIILFYIKKLNKNFFIISMIIFFIISFLIGERSNFLKIFLMISLFWIFFSKIHIYKRGIIFLIIVCFTTSFIFFHPVLKSKYYHHVVEPIIKSYDEEKKINIYLFTKSVEYFGLYNTAFEIFKENSFMGAGLKRFRYESYFYQSKNHELYGASTHPHQLHFELLSELGIIGYLLIIINILLLIISNINSVKKKENLFKIGPLLFMMAILFPFLPSGSFFGSYNAVFFWINYAFLINRNLK